MQVAKWGNSLAVRLPATVVEALHLKPGDNSDIHVRGDRSFAIEKAPGARDLLARIRKYRGRLPSDFKFDRVQAIDLSINGDITKVQPEPNTRR